MKTSLLPVLAGAGLCLAHISARGQEFKQHISKQFSMSSGTVAVYNVFGSVNVQGYSGNQVVMEIDETITADDQAALEQGKHDFKLGLDQKQDSLIAYIAEPYDSRPHLRTKRDDHQDIHYRVNLNFTIKVPNNVNLRVSTINDGQVVVKDVYGVLDLNNINGPLSIANAKGTTRANTVNGAITVNYLKIPAEASSYKTINGEVNVTYPAALSADLTFKSMNGQFFTDFQDAEILPSKVEKTQAKNNGGTVYKLSKNSDVRIGQGGRLFKFETLNGNIYIKKQQ